MTTADLIDQLRRAADRLERNPFDTHVSTDIATVLDELRQWRANQQTRLPILEETR